MSGGLVVGNDPLNATDPTGESCSSTQSECLGSIFAGIWNHTVTQIAPAVANEVVATVNFAIKSQNRIQTLGLIPAPQLPTPFPNVNQDVQDAITIVTAVAGTKGLGAARTTTTVARVAQATRPATTTVGRWMSPVEAAAMQRTGLVQESYTGLTHVANPASAGTYIRQAQPGSVYVEFSVPSSSLRSSGTGVSTIPGPAAPVRPTAGMPPATDIIIKGQK